MIPIKYKWASLAALYALTLAGMFATGWAWRGTIADLAGAIHIAELEKSHRKALEDARGDAEASQRAADESERRRLAEQGKERIVYRDIHNEVIRYVEVNASPDGCGLTDDGLSLWRKARDAEPVDSGEPIK